MGENKMIDNYTIFEIQNLQCKEIYFIHKEGKSFGRLNIQKETVTLDKLHVKQSCKKQGLGTEMQEIREQYVKNLGFKEVYLRVVENSWMYDWYIRRGYKYYLRSEDYNDRIWLVKELK